MLDFSPKTPTPVAPPPDIDHQANAEAREAARKTELANQKGRGRQSYAGRRIALDKRQTKATGGTDTTSASGLLLG